jgi:hypothetical protein
LFKSLGAEDGGGQFMKGLEVGSASFIAEFQSSEVSEPTEGAFDDVARLAEPAAVTMRFAQGSQDRLSDSDWQNHD